MADQVLTLQMVLRNVGATPAHGVIGKFTTLVSQGGKLFPMTDLPWRNGTTAPNGTIDLRLPIRLSPHQAQGLPNGRVNVTITLEVRYINAYGERWKYTHHLRVTNSSLRDGFANTDDCQQEREQDEDAPKEPKLL